MSIMKLSFLDLAGISHYQVLELVGEFDLVTFLKPPLFCLWFMHSFLLLLLLLFLYFAMSGLRYSLVAILLGKLVEAIRGCLFLR